MAYLELKKIGYQLHQDPQAISEEYNKRFNSIGTIKTNLFPSFMNRDDPSSKQCSYARFTDRFSSAL